MRRRFTFDVVHSFRYNIKQGKENHNESKDRSNVRDHNNVTFSLVRFVVFRDRFRTTCNVVGDAIGAAVVERLSVADFGNELNLNLELDEREVSEKFTRKEETSCTIFTDTLINEEASQDYNSVAS